MDTQLLTARQVADRLRLSRSRVYALLAAGDLPAVRIGGSVRVAEEALRRWVLSKTVPRPSISGEREAGGG